MKHVTTVLKDRPREATAEFRMGVHSAPYLGDHGFQDMVVLPGASYVCMALGVERELSERIPGAVRNIAFYNPVILSAEDAVIKVEVKDDGNGHVAYTFREAGAGNKVTQSSAQQYAARLEIDRNQTALPASRADAFSIEGFQAKSGSAIDSQQFYQTLRENSNQYGPHFQNVLSIWRTDHQLLGKLRIARQRGESAPAYLDPRLLDSATQLLAPFIMEKGKTFVLRSIEEIDIKDIDFPETLWGLATKLPAGKDDANAFMGNVRVYDSSGKLYLALSGVALTILDRDDVIEEKAAAPLVVSANFTAEPLQDALAFWSDHFGVRLHTEFVAYNQIFQQLLDTSSAFHRNSNGANVILIELTEWATTGRRGPMTLDKEKAERIFGTRARHVLPNGLEIVHLNRYETDYVYKEIFEDQCYLRHGIHLQDDAVVLDIGANIGLFSLFVMSRCANASIYACEPAPMVYDILKANCDAYGSRVRTLNVGVSDRAKAAMFTFYEKSSVFSGFHADAAEDRAAIQAIVRNMLNGASVNGESVEEYVRELTADRLARKTYECQLTSVSDIIRENRIEKIDLLKIDAEKSELDIIKGIENRDWPKIDQVVMEIHDPTRVAVRKIENLLTEKGYFCAVEEETLLENAGLFNLYATRLKAAAEPRGDSEPLPAMRSGRARAAAANLQRNVRDFGVALQSFTDQSKAPLLLFFCPWPPAATADAELNALLCDAEETLSVQAGKMANVHTIGSKSLLQRYPVDDYYDLDSHHVAHIPYTPACYAAIGTALTRTIYNLQRNPFKVIVLDCDNTLWKGVCGEDGPVGVAVTAPYRALQEFMVGQMKAGMLLCLCSKNNEQDVLDVFGQRSDMHLKREHLVAWRINWKSKSENIRSLAKELNLGLDSFIFVDDNPVECADVRITCPDVLTLQLPENAGLFPSFLNHVWAFDRGDSTREDQNRSRMYVESARREKYRGQTLSLKGFINGLQLRIEINKPTETQLDRVSQLTFRTNQFNFTTIRRSKNEIEDLLNRRDTSCLAVNVVDRFGDYGLVGVLIYEIRADRFKVDTFLLSCRVLGRGVEHSLVARIGQLAAREGKRFVEFHYSPTKKNVLALEFITGIGGQYRNETGMSWTFPSEHLAGVEYDPDDKTPVDVVVSETDHSDLPRARPALSFDLVDQSARIQKIGEDLHDIDSLMRAIDDYRHGGQFSQASTDPIQGNPLETALLGIWSKVLGRSRVGLNDNFFEVGGTSLRAVQVIAAIKRHLKQTLSIVSLFECPTVSLLAARLKGSSKALNDGQTAATAVLRGQQRRYNANRRKTS